MTELDLRAPPDPALRARLREVADGLGPAIPEPREARLARDPLRFIPEARRAAAAAPPAAPEPGPFELRPDDPDFVGFGWWEAERTAEGALRWSGLGPSASVLLPALGGSALRVALRLRAPFGIPLTLEGATLLLDGRPLALVTLANDGVVGEFAAQATLPPLPALAHIVLLLHGPRHADPGGRDARRLGLGLYALRLDRA